MHRMIILVVLGALLVIFGLKVQGLNDKKLRWILSFKMGFTQGFMIWGLFCISEWKNTYGIGEIFQIIFFSSCVGLMFWIGYFIIGSILNKIRNKQ